MVTKIISNFIGYPFPKNGKFDHSEKYQFYNCKFYTNYNKWFLKFSSLSLLLNVNSLQMYLFLWTKLTSEKVTETKINQHQRYENQSIVNPNA